jgi:hypothetical protein
VIRNRRDRIRRPSAGAQDARLPRYSRRRLRPRNAPSRHEFPDARRNRRGWNCWRTDRSKANHGTERPALNRSLSSFRRAAAKRGAQRRRESIAEIRAPACSGGTIFQTAAAARPSAAKGEARLIAPAGTALAARCASAPGLPEKRVEGESVPPVKSHRICGPLVTSRRRRQASRRTV